MHPARGGQGTTATTETGSVPTTFLDGVRTLSHRYAGFLVDQWGVIHDGVRPYADAVDALERLRGAGGRILLLSNSGARTAINLDRLHAIGLDPALVDGIVTSGEVTWRALIERNGGEFRALGARCVLWCRGGDTSVVERTGLKVVDAAAQAAFVLLTGTDDAARLEDFQAELDVALARRLPLVCANPDVRVVTPSGVAMAPGAIAAHYEAMGGQVLWIGKPYPLVYQRAVELLPPGPVLAVGDSLAHDIAGGAAQGYDTAFVLQGIHADAFPPGTTPDAQQQILARLGRDYDVTPTFALSTFRW